MSAIDVIGQEKGLSVPVYIRVALCPVGSINASTFKKYASLIVQKCEQIPLNRLTRFKDDNKKSPFQRMDWEKSVMRFYFVDGTNFSTQFTEVHQHKKVHAVIGIMSCLSENNVSHGYEKYLNMKKQFGSTVQIGKCFAVEQDYNNNNSNNTNNSNNSSSSSSSNANNAMVMDSAKDLVMIPSQDLQHLEFYIVSMFIDMAAELMRTFEAYASHPKHLISLALTHEEQQQQQQRKLSLMSDTTIKKRNEVKSLKIFADYAMLSGDYLDAITTYQQAAEMARTFVNEDPVTYASCLEGLASVLYWKYCLVVGSPNNLTPPMIEDVSLKCEEAIQWYSKSAAKELHVEALLRYARFNANGGSSQKMNALECITRAVEFSTYLTTQERILVCGYAAQICHSLGFKRKFAFFLRETAMLHGLLHNQSVSMRLGSLCLDSFNVPLLLNDSEWLHTKAQKKDATRGWQRLQLKLLRDVISFAASMSPADYLTEAQLTLYLLCAYHDVLKWAEQAELFERFCELSRRISQNSANISLLPLPLLGYVEPLKMPAHLEPIAHKEEDENKNSIFIFSPFDRDNSTVMKINWVQNELSKVNVTLRNPFLFEVILKRVSLKIKLEHGDCEVYETSAIIKPGKEQTVEITIKPLGYGRLQIEAIEIDFDKCNLKDPLTIPVPSLKKGEKDIEITVLEKIPLLNVHVPSSVIALFDGESLSTTLSFQNISSNAIHLITTSIESKLRSKLRIDNSRLHQSMPLNSNGQTISTDLYIDGRWGSGSNSVTLKVKYFGVSKAWYREIAIPLQLNIRRGLVLLSCLSVNEQYGREIVAEIENQSAYPFVLLSNNEEDVKQKLLQEKSIVERHNNVDWKQFVQGIPMAPGSRKMIVVGSHILHEKAGTEPDHPVEAFHIPYSANIDEYKEEIASRLRWKSFMNTYGVVGFVQPEAAPQPMYVNPYAKKKEEEALVQPKRKVDLKLSIEVGNTEDDNVLQLDNFDVDVIRTTPPTFNADSGTSQNLAWTLHCEPKHDKAFKVSIQIYQDAPNGSRVQVSSEQLAYAGQLSMSINNFSSDSSQPSDSSIDYKHKVQLFFLDTGFFNVSVECVDDETEELLAKPLQFVARIH